MSQQIDWQATLPIWETMPNVIAVWAFGSAADGTVRSGGDADVAALTEESLTFDEQLDLMGDLQSAIDFEAVDLALLNGANPIVRFEAVSGRLLFCTDRHAMAEFVSYTARVYEDEMALWQRALAARP